MLVFRYFSRYFTLGFIAVFVSLVLSGLASAQLNQLSSVPSKLPTAADMAHAQTVQIKSLYGTVHESNALVKQLIVHPAIQRLRKIDNAGPGRYFRSLPAYSLFDHALGVYVLLKRFSRPLSEQIAGMLEPVSHSVFAHQGTLYLKPKNTDLPYYLAAQSGFLQRVGLSNLLSQEHLNNQDIFPIKPQFKALYKNPPFLSAIEIEMTLRLAYSYKLLLGDDITSVLADLRFERGQWYFTTTASALRLAKLSLYFAERYWGSHQNYVLNRWVAAAMKRALDLKLLSVNDIRFGTDLNVLNRLLKMDDQIIRQLMIQCRQPFRFYDVVTSKDFDDNYKPEFRGLNPLVKKNGQLVRLSSLDTRFKQDFDALRQKFLDGIRIKYKQPILNQMGPNQENLGNWSSGVGAAEESDEPQTSSTAMSKGSE